jgi:8-oxo-dGTP pyrophosphatase MutT (NUDIX family)
MSKLLNLLYKVCQPGIYLLLHNSRRSRVLVICGDELLLIRSDFGLRRWSVPGGGIKRSETAVDGAVRELREEVGIRVKPSQLHELTQTTKGYGLLNWPRIHFVFFTVRLNKKPTLTLQKYEVTESHWLPLDKLSTANITPEALEVIREGALQ